MPAPKGFSEPLPVAATGWSAYGTTREGLVNGGLWRFNSLGAA
jgi:hypothetical protein